MRKLPLILGLLMGIMSGSSDVMAQQHSEQNHSKYIAPKDKLVQEKLAHWQDVKFGLLMHWGTYSEWGVVESWSICPEDEGWCERRGPYSKSWFEYKKAYENLQTKFNPTRFAPEKWADAAKKAGMKYVVFTTKHHDGFCMFDTKFSDYKVTSPKTPFSANPKSNIAKEVFNAFSKQDFMVGAYFSKPDWNTESYWWPYFPPKDRNVNYDPKKYPEKWQQFKDFTYNQIQELMTDYGKIDILWLDGGWVRPKESIDTTISWQKTIPYNQDIDMAKIAAMGRKNQPGLLVVDRTVSGEFENYVTPEQSIPDHYMPIPWETCMTMANSWSYVPNDEYKTTKKLIQTLIDVVAKNGNLLLNVGPGPDGEWHQDAYNRMQEIGKWMDVNGESIYGTKPKAPYRQGKWAFTQKEAVSYLTYLPENGENQLPLEVTLPVSAVSKKSIISIPGIKVPLKWKASAEGIKVVIPEKVSKQLDSQPAWVFKVS
ncbi:alpha-L-fucosidase [Pseudarcicella hirudinis]|uniref:alpha-L-fucosidase n=1 Tax=Pseudarcicella hirudinis TaxID=1079859 RepID=A0A1I5TE58_9BACT|nr:alpha-L-fucosidase [Pseudarcicella hirudinis]SFP81333.1 alpha-L-fucosidase [Pseudarcicella hirudinis]